MKKSLLVLFVSLVTLGVANPISKAEKGVSHQDSEGELVTNGNPISNGAISFN